MIKLEINKFGSPPDNVYISNVPDIKEIENDELIIEVLYFPINPADLLFIEGNYASKPKLPSSLGAECIAKVKRIGKDIKKFRIGDVVIPLSRDNWVEEKVCKETEVVKVNKNINLIQGSMLKVNPASAYLMLNNYVKIDQNNHIIQNASNSGLGRYIIQLCKIYGIKNINIVRREELKNNLKNIGADYVFTDKEVKNNFKFIKSLKAKLFIDAVAGENVDNIANLLEENSTIINYGLLSKKKIELNPSKIIFNNISLKGFWLTKWLAQMSYKEVTSLYIYLSELITYKKLHVPIQKVFYISEFKNAIITASKENRKGKIIITPKKQLIKGLLN